ncbi:MAG: type II secretion system F family protein [Planctomycetaceae bacterium]
MVSFATFFAAIFSVIGVYSIVTDIFLRDKIRLRERIEEELRQVQRSRAKSMLKTLSQNDLAGIMDAADDKRNFMTRLQDLLDQAGLHIKPVVLFYQAGGAALVVGVLAYLLRGDIWIALILATLAACAPFFYVRKMRDRRQSALRAQLADAFELMSSTLRAGQSMAQSLQAVAVDFPAPIAEEFMMCSEQQNLGLDPEIALRQMARRCGIIELKIFVVAVLVQRQVGGNLSDILQGLSNVVRERFRIMGLINTLTAEGRLQAVILMSLPPFLLLIMVVMNREYTSSLLDHPELLYGMAGSMFCGWLWIRKIVNFDF